jgi:hypothetical protein
MYPAYPTASYVAGLGSEEMIPPLRGLSSLVIPTEDTLMSDADSIFGKRAAEQQGDSIQEGNRVVVIRDGLDTGKLKKGRRAVNRGGNMECLEDLEATSQGAAGQLTGSHATIRQKQ